MAQNEAFVGDYVFSSNKIYEIINKYEYLNNFYYDLESVDNPSDFLEIESFDAVIEYMSTTNLTYSQLVRFGKIVKKEEARKAIEVLFSKT